MPLYEYKCLKCGHIFEELISSTKKAAPTCSACGSNQTEKRLSVFAVSVQDGPACGPGCGSCPGSSGGCPYSDE